VANLKTVGLWEDAAIEARHSLASGIGNLSVGGGAVSFGNTSLSDRISPWPHDSDIVAGIVSFESSANWGRDKSRLRVDARASIVAARLAGFFGESAFSGASSQVEGTYQDSEGFKTEPSTATVDLVEIGVPVERIEVEYRVDLNTLGADVTKLKMSAFGGVITADPFSFHTDTDVNNVTLNTEALDLTELLSLDEFQALDMTGSVAARLPVSIEEDVVTIADGVLTGNPPGGVIRYRPASSPDGSDVSGVAFATKVLSNLEYETLVSDVNLNKEGDLVLNLKLTGRNPDLDEKRPIVLNVAVENNIPQMLRSLRAARAVEDILEKQLGR
jgi:hypothetical protein